MSLSLNHEIPRYAILLASFMLSTCGSSRKEYVHPADISYQNMPGFHAAPALSVSEWSAVDDDTAQVTASLQAGHGLRLRWLGTAGFELSDDSTTILIDPFVSRPAMPELAQALSIDTAAVNRYVLAPLLPKKIKAILISHPHHDHFQDVPYILAQFPDPASRPVVIGSSNVFRLLQGYSQDSNLAWVRNVGGLHNTRVEIVEFTAQNKDCLKPSSQVACPAGAYGDFSITAFGSDHPSYDYLPGVVIDGYVSGRAPYRATEYKTWLNTSIGFLVEYRDLRFFFSESPIVRHAGQVGHVDVLIQGIASRKDCDFIANTMAAVQPRYVIPSHYDDFFKPLTEFQKFDVKIGEGPVDFSRFEEFVRGYDKEYVASARSLIPEGGRAFSPKLRLLKLFYYYSLERVVPVK